MSKKQQDHSRLTGLATGYRVFIPGVRIGERIATTHAAKRQKWWSLSGSNR